MKTPDDPRHKRRQYLVQELFKSEFHEQELAEDAKTILSHKDAIDEKIRQAALLS